MFASAEPKPCLQTLTNWSNVGVGIFTAKFQTGSPIIHQMVASNYQEK